MKKRMKLSYQFVICIYFLPKLINIIENQVGATFIRRNAFNRPIMHVMDCLPPLLAFNYRPRINFEMNVKKIINAAPELRRSNCESR